MKYHNPHFIAMGSYLPEQVISNDYFTEAVAASDLEGEVFFKGVSERRWASPHETSVYMGTMAGQDLLAKTGSDPGGIDLIIASALIDDHLLPHVACGIQYGLNARNATAITLDTGCASFVSGIIYASALIRSGFFNRILLISVSNFAGRVQGKLKDRSAVIPGDGAAALLIEGREDTPDGLLGWWEKSFGEHYGYFGIHPYNTRGDEVSLWEAHNGIRFSFDGGMVDSIKSNSRSLVPMALKEALHRSGRTINEVDLVLTHQPNRYLIDYWRQSIGVCKGKAHDTLERYGNMFQASIPVTLEDAIIQGKVKSGDVVAMASFAFAGELASSAVIRWD